MQVIHRLFSVLPPVSPGRRWLREVDRQNRKVLHDAALLQNYADEGWTVEDVAIAHQVPLSEVLRAAQRYSVTLAMAPEHVTHAKDSTWPDPVVGLAHAAQRNSWTIR